MAADDDDRAHDDLDEAAEELYGAPLTAFTAVRKRLADALKVRGARAAATAVSKLPRPSMGAWVVNRLWREVRGEVEALIAAGDRVRAGRGAVEDQRSALARLRAHVPQILAADGHAASPGNVGRVATTLHALSAVGGFAPDKPGRLLVDREPPGFDLEMVVPAVPVAPRKAAEAPKNDNHNDDEHDHEPEREREREREREQERERVAREAERARLARAVEDAERAVGQRTAELTALEQNLRAAEDVVTTLRERVRFVNAALETARRRAVTAAAELAAVDQGR